MLATFTSLFWKSSIRTALPCGLLTLLLCVGSNQATAQLIDQTSFEAYSDEFKFVGAEWRQVGFTPRWGEGNGFDQSRVYVDRGEARVGSASLRFIYPAGQAGAGSTGGQMPLDFAATDEAYTSYWLRFSDNFDWGGTNEGGKLPGLAGGDLCSGGATCTGTNGFSARLMWRPAGKAVLYLYHMDKPGKFGEDIDLKEPDGTNVFFTPGEWVHVTERVRINSVSNGQANADGLVEVWINGTKVLRQTGLRFRTNSDRVNSLYFSTFHGGNDSTWAPSVSCFTWFDDVRIGRTYDDVKMPGSSGGGATVTVRAKMLNGASDKLELRVDDQTVQTWTISGAGYKNYTANVSAAGNVKLYFPDNGTDLQIDYLEVGGTTYQAEAQQTNTSVWQNGSCGGTRSEIMHCRGYIDFGSVGSSTLTLRARGSCGSETMVLNVGGENVATWNNLSTSYQDYTYDDYTGGTVRVRFTNDGNDGCDRNLQLDYLRVGSTTYQTENSATRTGCGSGEQLWCTGDFNFGNLGNSKDAGSPTSTLSPDVAAAPFLYPNPATNSVRIVGNDRYLIEIFDLSGRQVWRQTGLSGNSTVDLSGFKTGAYLVRKAEGERVVTSRLVVNR